MVLIVEDNDVNQILAATMLERRGYRTEVAADGRQALGVLEQRRHRRRAHGLPDARAERIRHHPGAPPTAHGEPAPP